MGSELALPVMLWDSLYTNYQSPLPPFSETSRLLDLPSGDWVDLDQKVNRGHHKMDSAFPIPDFRLFLETGHKGILNRHVPSWRYPSDPVRHTNKPTVSLLSGSFLCGSNHQSEPWCEGWKFSFTGILFNEYKRHKDKSLRSYPYYCHWWSDVQISNIPISEKPYRQFLNYLR